MVCRDDKAPQSSVWGASWWGLRSVLTMVSLPWLIVEPCIRHARLGYCSQSDEGSAALYVPSPFLEAVARNQTEQPALIYGGFYLCSWVK